MTQQVAMTQPVSVPQPLSNRRRMTRLSRRVALVGATAKAAGRQRWWPLSLLAS